MLLSFYVNKIEPQQSVDCTLQLLNIPIAVNNIAAFKESHGNFTSIIVNFIIVYIQGDLI